MELITGSKESKPVYVPRVSVQQASQLFTKLYDVKVDKIKQLAGYCVKNFYIRTLPAEGTDDDDDDEKCGEYVLKIYSTETTKEVIEVSVAIMLHLKNHGIACSTPVKTQRGEYLTMEEFACSQKAVDSDGESFGKPIYLCCCITIYLFFLLHGRVLDLHLLLLKGYSEIIAVRFLHFGNEIDV